MCVKISLYKVAVVGMLLVGLSCKHRSDSAVKEDKDTPATSDAPAAVIPGTDEALKSFPPLNEEFAPLPDAEEKEFALFADMIHFLQEELQKKHDPASDQPLRGFHAKAHGCLAGHFYVVDQPAFPESYADKSLADSTKVGLYAGGFGDEATGIPGFSKRYPVLVRYSNAQGQRQTDVKIDGKGMAVKVLAKTADGQAFDQDFTMSDTPTCNAATAARFMAFGMALAGIHDEMKLNVATEVASMSTETLAGNIPDLNKSQVYARLLEQIKRRQQNLGEALPPSLRFLLDNDNKPTRVAVASMIKESFGKTRSTEMQYWSRTPYHLGDKAVKFTAIPRSCCDPNSGFADIAGCPAQGANTPAGGRLAQLRERIRAFNQKLKGTFTNVKTVAKDQVRKLTDDRSFRDNLIAAAQQPICFDFAYMFQTDPEATPVENPTVAWSPALAPPVVFAKIVLPPQSFDSDEQNNMCEGIGWTPEHFLPDHKPMGHMNRARLAVYNASRKLRREKDGEFDARNYPIKLFQ